MDSAFRTPPVVLDTNVLVAGAARHDQSAAYAVLLAVLQGEIPLVITSAIALEYQEVLQRDRIMAMTGLSHHQSTDLVTDLIALSEQVQIYFQWRPNLLDESDNKFVEAALHTGATIVTYNTRDYENAELPRFGWNWMSPHEFVLKYLQ